MSSISPKGEEILPESGEIFPVFREASYFLNRYGQVDSIHHYLDSEGWGKKDVFTYDADRRLIKLEKTRRGGMIYKAESVEQNSNGDWYYRLWNQGHLELEIVSRCDSLIRRTTRHAGVSRSHFYMVDAYDFERDTRTETWYEDETIRTQRIYQWQLRDGKPLKLHYRTYRLENGQSQTFEQTYGVREDGYLSTYPGSNEKGPSWALNFYKRVERFRGITHPNQQFFKANVLQTRSPVVQLLAKFDGTHSRHYYTFVYE